jgi:integrase
LRNFGVFGLGPILDPKILKICAAASVIIKIMDKMLTESQISRIFNINPVTLKKLIREGKFPVVTKDSKRPLFDMKTISEWIINNPLIQNDEEVYLKKLEKEWRETSPEVFAALKDIDNKVAAHSNAQKNPKRYNLIKRASKKYGYLYYVRYVDKGKPLPSKWNTHTNILHEAEQFAVENRDRIISAYYAKHALKNGGSVMYAVLEDYYRAGSQYLEKDKNRNRTICEKTRSVYYHFMIDKFIPYLQENSINAFEKITPPVIANFQDHLLAIGLKPQTINRYLSGVNYAFNQLLIKGVIKENAFDRVKSLKEDPKSEKRRGGCFDINIMKGVFATEWEDGPSYLVCLMIYAAGMRNSEIEKMRVNDIIDIEGVHFIDIKESKSEYGVRLVPLHGFVYKALQRSIRRTGKKGDDYIFSAHGGPNQSTFYKKAVCLLMEKLNLSEEDLKKQKITFYSGRHFWKTALNSGGLGEDIEEFFMGHKVSGDVAKNYNHKDKQGRDKLLEKAQEVFVILDKKLFS